MATKKQIKGVDLNCINNQDKWKDIKSSYRGLIISFVGFVLSLIFSFIFRIEWIAVYIGTLFFISWGFYTFSYRISTCPVCGNHFFALRNALYPKSCCSCGSQVK